MRFDAETIKNEFRAQAKPGFDCDAEAAHLLALGKEPEIERVLLPYEYGRFIKAGGSGMVFEVIDSRSKSKRALKISRVSALPATDDSSNPVDVDLEIQALSLVNHQNVTRFFDGFITKSKHYALITQLVESPCAVHEWLATQIGLNFADEDGSVLPASDANSQQRLSEETINEAFVSLTEALHGYSSALAYMHDSLDLYHMDIKPWNLLVDKHDTPFVTDLGFARYKARYKEHDQVPVGFTFGFNHPILIEHNPHRFVISKTPARARNIIPASDLSPRFDLYSFGRTILFLLNLFEQRFGERIRNNYYFLYLHLLATLLLDDRNQPISKKDVNNKFSNEHALGIEEDLLTTFKIQSFKVVTNRFERLLGMRPIEHRLHELNPWHPRSLNHGQGYLNVTARITSIINHPAFRRLRECSQLGIIAEVYPGATHTRQAHSLGVTGVVCDILLALYNDPENPIFKLLVEDQDLKEVLVASLIHDLGQSDFAHELEEISKQLYDHSMVTARILTHSDCQDSRGRTLQQIIEGNGTDEWGLNFESVLSILGLSSHPKRFAAFTNIIDGPIDADKIDYLKRDGFCSNVSYPLGFDEKRFLKCVTILPVKVERGHRALKLGIKEKGIAASEAIAIARRQMYQSVKWPPSFGQKNAEIKLGFQALLD